jgi:hypothetical protein
MAYIGICGYSKDDEERIYPCFLGLGKNGEFTFWGYSFGDIRYHSKVVAGEAEKESYEEADVVDRINLGNLWVEINENFDTKSKQAIEYAEDLKTRVEALFPDYNVFITTYPEDTMNKYYHYWDGKLPQELEDAYLVFSDKLRSVEVDKEKEVFAWPW